MTGPVLTTLIFPNPAVGNLTADGNTNVLSGGSASGIFIPQPNLSNMADGDVTEFRSYKRANTSDGVVSAEAFGSGTGAQTQFLHALGGGLTGMTLNQAGVTSSTTGAVTIATPPATIPVSGNFYVLNLTRLEWAIAFYVSSTSINLVTRGVLGTTAAAWTSGDALTIAAQPVQPGSVIVTAPGAIVSTDTPTFGNPATTGAPNGLSGVVGGTGVASGVIAYASGAVTINYSAAPASGTNNITVNYTQLFQKDYWSANNKQSTPLVTWPPLVTEGAVMFSLKQIAGTNRAYQFGVLNSLGT